MHNIYNKMFNFTKPFLHSEIQQCIEYSERVHTAELSYSVIEDIE